MLAMYKIRIIARACITRYDTGEGSIAEIVASYKLAPEDTEAVLAYIYAERPDIV